LDAFIPLAIVVGCCFFPTALIGAAISHCGVGLLPISIRGFAGDVEFTKQQAEIRSMC
jgi:hypothetical protein